MLHSVAKKSAGIILSVAYDALSIKYRTRAQLSSASKTLKLGIKDRHFQKEEYLVPVARTLIKEGYLEFKASSENIARDNIAKLKYFQDLFCTWLVKPKPFVI